jgi:four helix bundle protein
MNRHRSLTASTRSQDLAVAVHRAARLLPRAERFELGSQLRRAATSVPANIAEGFARRGAREFSHFLSMALGSLAEIDALPALIRELGYLEPATLDGIEPLRDSASAAVFALMRRMRGSG